jgi:hypothetical protein
MAARHTRTSLSAVEGSFAAQARKLVTGDDPSEHAWRCRRDALAKWKSTSSPFLNRVPGRILWGPL